MAVANPRRTQANHRVDRTAALPLRFDADRADSMPGYGDVSGLSAAVGHSNRWESQ